MILLNANLILKFVVAYVEVIKKMFLHKKRRITKNPISDFYFEKILANAPSAYVGVVKI